MKLNKIVAALALSVAVAVPSVALANTEEKTSDYVLDGAIIGGLAWSAGPIGAVVGVGVLGYMNGWFGDWSEHQWIEGIAMEKDMPAGYVNVAYIIKDFAERCEAAGYKAGAFSTVADIKNWGYAMQTANSELDAGNGWGGMKSVDKYSTDDDKFETRMQARVMLRGSTYIGAVCVGQSQAGSRTLNTVNARLEAWVSKKDGKYHLIEENDYAHTHQHQVVDVAVAIKAGQRYRDGVVRGEKVFD